MMMMGLHFMKDKPFRRSTSIAWFAMRGREDVEVEGQCRRSPGSDRDYGADALRFALARAAAQGHDIKLSPQLVETNRNFATKLWNACRFAEMNDCVLPPDFRSDRGEGDAEPLESHTRLRAPPAR